MTQWREGTCPRGVDDGFDMIRTAHFALSRKLLLQLGDRYRRTNRQVVISPFPQPGIVQTRLPEVQPDIMLQRNRHHPRWQARLQQVAQ